MSVSAITALSSSTLTASTTSTGGTTSSPSANALGQDAFFLLLLAELSNQDPFNPMEDRDFVAQLAQLNSLNELTEINDTLSDINDTLSEMSGSSSDSDSVSLAEASTLLGKVVTGESESGSTVTGTVTGLYLVDGEVILDVDGVAVPLGGISQVTEPEEEPESS